MFEKLRIKQHMEVTDANGQHLGTVDEVDGDTIKLTRSDSSDGQHHYLDFDAVDRIDDNRVYLKAGFTPKVRVAEQQYQSGTQQQQFGGNQPHVDPNTYSSTAAAAGNTAAETPLFGASGNGHVMTGANKE